MPKLVLVTGGAGFIGSHLVDRLLDQGHTVRILDNLEPQIHPKGKPDYLNARAEFILGDVRDRDTFAKALEGIETVFHFAAAVGTGQSMYQIKKYVDVNVGGLANLLDVLVATGARPKVIFPGSATSYGECAHRCSEHGIVFPDLRSVEQLQQQRWELECPTCGRAMEAVPIPETQPLRPKFVYGLNKKKCEELLQAVGEAYDLPFTILRFFNVYGPRQSLSNPYTGVIPIFSSRIKNGRSPLVIEDGKESRDFISVRDIIEACVSVHERDETNGRILNVGTGRPIPILAIAKLLLELHGSILEPEINGEFRKHDFRHSIADISKIRSLVGFEPRVRFEDGMKELFAWTSQQEATDDFDGAYAELRRRGMVGGPKGPGQKPTVAAIILNWNGFDNTVECITSLQKSSYKQLRIVVVDNGSKENDDARLRDRFGETITVLAHPVNAGVAEGNNIGLHHVLADENVRYCLIMNNDLMVEPRAVEALVEVAESDPSIGMVASKMMNYFRRDVVDNLGIVLLKSGLSYNRKNDAVPLFCPCSGFGLYRASALREIVLPGQEVWDRDFFAYVDELDVGFRLRLQGYHAAYADGAVAYHKDGATSGGAESDFSLYHGHRNNLWFLLKNFPAALWFAHLGPILATQIGTFALFTRRRRLTVILKAKADAIKKIPLMLGKRRFIQRNRKASVRSLEKVMLNKTYVRPSRMITLSGSPLYDSAVE